MKRQNLSLSNGGLDCWLRHHRVSQRLAGTVDGDFRPQATADRRTTTDAVRWEGERLRSVG